MSFDFGKLYLPPTPEQEQALREDIRRHGIRNPILVTHDGKVIAGNTRKRIADELGIECPTEVFEGTVAEQLAAAVLENPKREVAPDQRREAATLLHELEGWSYRRIAECLGVSEKTIRNDLRAFATADKSAVANRTENRREGHGLQVGQDGRRRPARRPTGDERRRRRSAVERLYQQGHTVEQIGAALDISASTAAADVRELGLNRQGRRLKDLRHDTPESIDWRREPDKEASPLLYETSTVTADALHWIEGFNGGDYPNVLAWNIDEALEHDDTEWLTYAVQLIAEGHDQFSRLLRVCTDKDYRQTCRRGDIEIRTRSGVSSLKRQLDFAKATVNELTAVEAGDGSPA
jgi:DNA-directed RNA polymerase specialized sigma24 family protein